MRLATFLPEFLERFNEKFSVRGEADSLRRRLTVSPDRLSDILCHREQRHVGQQLTLAYDRKQLILDRSALSEDLGGQYVDLYDFADGRLEVRWKGRVSHTAIIENKRLGHALAIIKAQQDLKYVPKVKTNSEKIGYQKRERKSEAVEMTA
jgi:hypothetical protein